MWKVSPLVFGAGIRTHNLLIMSLLPLPLDQALGTLMVLMLLILLLRCSHKIDPFLRTTKSDQKDALLISSTAKYLISEITFCINQHLIFYHPSQAWFRRTANDGLRLENFQHLFKYVFLRERLVLLSHTSKAKYKLGHCVKLKETVKQI